MKPIVTPLIIAACATAVEAAPPTTRIVAEGLSRPIFVTAAPGDTSRIFVIEQAGRIIEVDLADGTQSVFLDIVSSVEDGGSEQGLLGLAFPDDFDPLSTTDNDFYVHYTSDDSRFGTTVIARYRTDPSGNADAGSEQRLLTFPQFRTNHNGGWIGFGPDDGYLYIAIGDGGDGNDPGNRAQDITNELQGKILRIGVDTTTASYTIPPDNPFVGLPGDDEIWHFGLRNPFRCSFDPATGSLWIGDVGQSAREEVSVQDAPGVGGLNFGWRCMEGTLCTGLSGCTCNDVALTMPVYDYPTSLGCAITGGYVYRGSAVPELQGLYVFADYCAGRIFGIDAADALAGLPVTRQEFTAELGTQVGLIPSFGRDAEGELYICDIFGGRVVKIVPGCDGDADGNGVTDLDDFTVLAVLFGNTVTPGTSADFSGNGTVDLDDFSILAINFGCGT